MQIKGASKCLINSCDFQSVLKEADAAINIESCDEVEIVETRVLETKAKVSLLVRDTLRTKIVQS